MTPFLDIHSHNDATGTSELAVRNFLLNDINSHLKECEQSALFSIGIHPCYIPKSLTEAWKNIDHFIGLSSCAAIGEAGLDKRANASMTIQRQVFVRQLETAAEHELPVIVHCVRAWNELMETYKPFQSVVPCIIHGFRGRPELAHSLLNQGFCLSFGVRFNIESLKLCPFERLFLETDEQTQPIKEHYDTVAKIRSCDTELLKIQCFDNLRNLNKKLQVSVKGRTFAG